MTDDRTSSTAARRLGNAIADPDQMPDDKDIWDLIADVQAEARQQGYDAALAAVREGVGALWDTATQDDDEDATAALESAMDVIDRLEGAARP